MEANSEKQTAELVKRLTEHAEAQGLAADVMVDGDGRMVVFQTAHSNHDDLVVYSSTQACRLLMHDMAYLLIGSPVVKVFRVANTTMASFGKDVVA